MAEWNYNYLADEVLEGNLPNEYSPTFIKRKGVSWAVVIMVYHLLQCNRKITLYYKIIYNIKK